MMAAMPVHIYPQDILTPEEYSNYRWVRVALWVFMIGGLVVLFGGIVFLLSGLLGSVSPDQKPGTIGLGAVMLVAGLIAVGGGLNAMHAKRRWAWLMYVIALPYLFAIPVGTILSYVVLKGLPSYLRSVEKLRGQNSN
jgi:hypothetical protein